LGSFRKRVISALVKRTNLDKRRSVELALAEWPKLSNVKLAEICCVSDEMVRGIKESIQVPKFGTCIGKDGKEYPATKPKAQKIEPEPVEPEIEPPHVQASSVNAFPG
jgi:hypothetical protein